MCYISLTLLENEEVAETAMKSSGVFFILSSNIIKLGCLWIGAVFDEQQRRNGSPSFPEMVPVMDNNLGSELGILGTNDVVLGGTGTGLPDPSKFTRSKT